MKLMIREFLSSLRERDELDAILPDLLSELGYNVFSRPKRGTTQHGVDIAAVGDEGGIPKIFLFSVKQGDLSRQEWDGSPQALRASLNEIRDVYIPTRIPKRYRDLPVVICLCFGGDVLEPVRAALTGYVAENSTERISFDEWNGDRIAGYILEGVLRETLLPKPLRASFQKAVALVDEPDVSYHHFISLIGQIRATLGAKSAARVTAARQIYVCLWVLYVWARDIDNVEAAYRCSEVALLSVWDWLRPSIGKRTRDARSIALALHQIIELHFTIAATYLDRKIMPHVSKRHAISFAVGSRSAVDINLALFDILGRMSLTGLWVSWFGDRGDDTAKKATSDQVLELLSKAIQLIANNPALMLPISDSQSIDIALLLQLYIVSGGRNDDIEIWLTRMAERVDFSTRAHGRYPCVFTEYRDLADHPRERSEEYRRDATAGSVLIPLLACWLSALGAQSTLETLKELTETDLQHCTLQLWLPDEATEDAIYSGGDDSGVSLCDLTISTDSQELLLEVWDACKNEGAFDALSAIRSGYWPIVLVACRHYRLPVPPHFWINALTAGRSAPAS